MLSVTYLSFVLLVASIASADLGGHHGISHMHKRSRNLSRKAAAPKAAPAVQFTGSSMRSQVKTSSKGTPIKGKKTAATGSCACGYQDDQGNLWREAVTSDFTQNTMNVLSQDWTPRVWTALPGTDAPEAEQRLAANVYAYNGMLGLETSAYNSSTQIAYVGEIESNRNDIWYGTFRMRGAAPAVPGVAFSFFSYRDDVTGSDIAIRSSDTTPTIYYADQPESPLSVTAPGASLTTVSGVHRFDWMPNSVSFSYTADGGSKITKDVNTNDVAQWPVRLMANCRSNGGSFTAGPPTQKAVAQIQSIQAYFNSSSFTDAQLQSQCNAAGSPSVCLI